MLASRVRARALRCARPARALSSAAAVGYMPNPFRTPERDAFRQTMRDFVASEITPFADEWDEAGEVPWELHQKVGALGVWGFGIDEKYGGLGFDDAFMRAIYGEELHLCGAGGVAAALNGRQISVEPIARLASDEIRERVLADIVAGRIGSALGITEPGGGSDVANMQTSARRDGDEYVLDGSKTFITGLSRARLCPAACAASPAARP